MLAFRKTSERRSFVDNMSVGMLMRLYVLYVYHRVVGLGASTRNPKP